MKIPKKPMIYVFKLENDTYFINYANDVNKAFDDHKNGNVSIYTTENKPVSIIEKRQSYIPDDFHNVVAEYALKYGSEKVRGSLCTSNDPVFHGFDMDYFPDLIKHIIFKYKGLCENCGREGHKEKYCRYKTDIYGEDISNINKKDYICKKCNREFENRTIINRHRKWCKSDYERYEVLKNENKCLRCERIGHNYKECEEIYDVNGYHLDPDICYKMDIII